MALTLSALRSELARMEREGYPDDTPVRIWNEHHGYVEIDECVADDTDGPVLEIHVLDLPEPAVGRDSWRG